MDMGHWWIFSSRHRSSTMDPASSMDRLVLAMALAMAWINSRRIFGSELADGYHATALRLARL